MADMHGVLQIEMCRERRQIVGIVIHVVPIGDLRGAAMATAVMGDDAEAVAWKNSICVSQSSDDSGQPWLNTIGCPLPQSL
jgi:hypothetical protein